MSIGNSSSNLSPGWDTFLKIIIGILIPVLPLCFAIYQHSTQTAHNLEERFRQELWLQKKETYSDICNVLGSISTGKGDETEYNNDIKKFYALYYGGARLIDDPVVHSYLSNIMEWLISFDRNKPEQLNVLREQVLSLSDLCRKSLLKN